MRILVFQLLIGRIPMIWQFGYRIPFILIKLFVQDLKLSLSLIIVLIKDSMKVGINSHLHHWNSDNE